MKQIKLKDSDKFVLVDDEDFEFLNKLTWHYMSRDSTCYAITKIQGIWLQMYNLLIQKDDDNDEVVVDHIDRNPLNNQRKNLRLITHYQNCLNRGISKNNRSGYKGVCKSKSEKNPWRVIITINGHPSHMGQYKSKHEAARAYNKFARIYHGKFAYQNIIKDEF